MNNWYTRSMPTVKDVSPQMGEIARSVKAMKGVEAVYVHGSYAAHEHEPSFTLNDIDIIAATDFDSGDLLAIDAGRDSPLRINPRELEDLGFNADAVAFTKSFLGLKKYNVDHWATTGDGKLLHWGPTPESVEEWSEAHSEAEKYAQEMTGYNRMKLAKSGDEVKVQWYEAFTHSMNRGVTRKQKLLGWYPSEHPAAETLANAKKLYPVENETTQTPKATP
jgi:hypothetical protein